MGIERGNITIIPKGDTVIEAFDIIILNAKKTKYYDLNLKEVHIDFIHPWKDKELKDIKLETNNLIVMIKRDNTTIIPKGNTIIKYGDTVLLREI